MTDTTQISLDQPVISATQAEPLFDLGFIVITPGAQRAIAASGSRATPYLMRHASGDWSEMDEVDRKQNSFAVEKALRVFSAYTLGSGKKLWIVTEWDRSVTTLLMPAEY
jgi:hypothetical protein